jgi:hypothetical protein
VDALRRSPGVARVAAGLVFLLVCYPDLGGSAGKLRNRCAMTVSRWTVKFKRMFEMISSCRWKVSVPSDRNSYVGSIERPFER